MSNTPFRPLDGQLDADKALKTLQGATLGADDGELFLERARSESIVIDDGRIKNASYDAIEALACAQFAAKCRALHILPKSHTQRLSARPKPRV